MEWILDLVLIALLTVTLFHAVRLERALGVLKSDRAQLQMLVEGFNTSTRQAEAGAERLRTAADGAGRQIARQIDAASSLKEDLGFLSQRGEQLADRLEHLIRTGRPLGAEAPSETLREPMRELETTAPRVRSQAERELLRALRIAR